MWQTSVQLIGFTVILSCHVENIWKIVAAEQINHKENHESDKKTVSVMAKVLTNLLNTQNTSVTIDNNLTKAEIDYIVQQYNLGSNDEDIKLDIMQLITKYGYPVEKHEVQTEDGYLLSVFRIPRKGPIVFIMHGLLGSADDWIITGPDKGLAYLLAEEGYDVWLGNARGNKHSRKHIKMSPLSTQFWNFSWEQIGCYDLPAMIDYALNTTNKKNLKYIGFSQGTTTFFVMCSMKPEYNEKISLMVALSAVAWMSNIKSALLKPLSTFNFLMHIYSQATGFLEFKLTSGMKKYVSTMCSNKQLAEILCSNILFLIFGFNRRQFNITKLPVILAHNPAGASINQLLHYGQEIQSGHFRRFDYGENENMNHYGTPSPPNYPVEKITAPVVIFFGEGDWLSDMADVKILRSKLTNLIEFYIVPDKNFNHIDFMWANDVKILVFSKLSQILKKF